MPQERLADRILKIIEGNPLSILEISEWLGTTKDTIGSAIRRENDLFRISGWRREPGHIVALWIPADGQPSKKKPRCLTNKEKKHRYVTKKARYPELYVKNVIPSAPVSHWHAFL